MASGTILENSRLKDTITTVDSEVYDSIVEHKHSLDQDTAELSIYKLMSYFSFANENLAMRQI